MKQKFIFIFRFLILVCILPSTGKASPNYSHINEVTLEKHILPRYTDLVQKTKALRLTVNRLCKNVSSTRLFEARTTFHDALDSWQSIEHIRFGPVESISAHARLNFWPDRRNRVGKHLRQLLVRTNKKILKPSAFELGSVAVQGFPALERLLFAKTAERNFSETESIITPCRAANAMTANIVSISLKIVSLWKNKQFAFKKSKNGTGELFNSLASGLKGIAELKLKGPVGSATGRARPKRAENWRSSREIKNIRWNLSALNNLYKHMANTAGSILSETPHDNIIRQLFKRTLNDLDSLGPSMGAMLATDQGRLKVKVLAADILDLRELIITHVAEALNLTIGFNSLDGD